MRTRSSEQVAELLKRLRQRQRVSQGELADLAVLSRTAITNLERGFDQTGRATNPRPDTLRRLAKGLATDGTGVLHPTLEEQFYADLMDAAGYMPSSWSMADALRGRIPETDIPGYVEQHKNSPIEDQQAAAQEIIDSYNRVVDRANIKPSQRRNRPA